MTEYTREELTWLFTLCAALGSAMGSVSPEATFADALVCSWAISCVVFFGYRCIRGRR